MLFVLTGNGKGKTTSALGMALRKIGAGERVFFLQFIKGKEYSEIKALRLLKDVEIHITGRVCFIRRDPDAEDIERARKAWALCKEQFGLGFGLYVLDELTIALHYGMLDAQEVARVLKDASTSVDIVVTGRYAPDWLIDLADMVSEIREVKHHYRKGIAAREGIEY